MSFVQPRSPRTVVVDDVSALTEPDARTLETLARLQLAAGRLGASVRLRRASAALIDLIAWAGLADVLPVESVVEVHGPTEHREQLLVDEEVDPGDPAA